MSETDGDKPHRIVFMGTPAIAAAVLEGLLNGPDEIVAVVTKPDRPAGRGRRRHESEVKQLANEHGLVVLQPQSPRRDPALLEQLRALEPDVSVVVAYGHILPQDILDVPRLGSVNVHASVLPKLRGAAPINWAIVRGFDRSGVTIMRMDAGMDTGDILEIREVAIAEGMTAGELHDALIPPAISALRTVLDDARATGEEIVGRPQDHQQATYAPRLCKQDGLVDWARPADEIVDKIHGLNPWPGAFTHFATGPYEGTSMKIHRAVALDATGVDAEPGQVIDADKRLVVAAGRGAVELTRVQISGRRAMDASSLLNGFPIEQGTRFLRSDGQSATDGKT